MKVRHVIIGNSAAGTKAAETIRSLDGEASITIISDEPGRPYSRCLLPNYLAGTRRETALAFKPVSFYSHNRIDLIEGFRAIGVDPEAKTVELQEGRIVGYDKLLIATGARTAFPPIPGLNGPGSFGLRTLTDAQGILEAMPASRRAVVIGAGFVGLETAYALYQRGLEVTVVEKLAQVLPQQFDSKAATILQADMQAEGMRFILGRGIEEVVGSRRWDWLFSGKGKGIILEGGQHLKAELVVVATGTRPNTELVQGTNVRVERGIVVDSYMGTSVADVYAAGDVAESVDMVTGTKGLTPIWPNAVAQGKVAGYNMAGVKRCNSAYLGMQNAVEFREVPAIAVGITQPVGDHYEVLSMYRPRRKLYKKLVLKDNRLVGIILVGDIRAAGVLVGLIKKQVTVNRLKHLLLRDDLSYGYFVG